MRNAFAKDGYAILKNLIKEPARDFLHDYAVKAAKSGKLCTPDDAFPTTPCSYGDPLMDSLMEELRPQIERVTGYKLFPTYSYLRVYKRGDVLKRHTDRPSCEISVTLNLGYKAAKPWPIWVESKGDPIDVHLKPGDGMVYKGIDVPHWRKRFSGEYAAQVFLHYVDRKGPRRNYIYDRRPGLSTSPVFQALIRKLAAS